MSRFTRRSRYTAVAIMIGFSGIGSTAADGPATDEIMEEIVVTGTCIRGSREDSALHVSVFSSETLAEQGSPNFVELVQRVPAVSGFSIGESNRFIGGARRAPQRSTCVDSAIPERWFS